jgi:hypothetical protein
MHQDDVGRYEGPPCEICRTTMFVGTCTHRPRKQKQILLPKEVPFTEAELKTLMNSPFKVPDLPDPADEKL